MTRESFTVLALLLILTLFLQACSSSTTPAAPTSAFGRAQAPATASPQAPVPSEINTLAYYKPRVTMMPFGFTPLPGSPFNPPPATPSSTPAVIGTQITLPAPEALKATFDGETAALVKKLQAAKDDPAIEINSADQVIFVPQSDRLNYVQTILNPGGTPAGLSGKKVYLLYTYSRGGSLSKVNAGQLGLTADTQVIKTTLRLVAEENGQFYLVEKEDGTSGSSGASLQDLVERAVSTLSKLPASNSAIEKNLEAIIGYACGIDMDPALDYQRKAALLTYALSAATWPERRQAADALSELNPLPLDSAPALIGVLSDSRDGVATAADTVLAKMADNQQVLALLLKAAADSNAKVRTNAARTLRLMETKPEVVYKTFLMLFYDKDLFVRQEAKSGLSETGSPLMLQDMLAALDNKDPAIRQAAVEVLQFYGAQSVSATPELAAALKDSDAGVRAAAALALEETDGQAKTSLPDLIAAAGRETAADAFKAEISTIAQFSSKAETMPLLEAAYASSRQNTHLMLGPILENYQEVPGAVALLVKTLGDKDAYVSRNAAWALAKFGSQARDALPDLIKAARAETDYRGFLYKMQAIAAISSQADSLPLLKEALANNNASIRKAACDTLAVYEARPGVLDLLNVALGDKDKEVNQCAAAALKHMQFTPTPTPE